MERNINEMKQVLEAHLPKNNPLIKEILGPFPKKFEDILREEEISVIE